MQSSMPRIEQVSPLLDLSSSQPLPYLPPELWQIIAMFVKEKTCLKNMSFVSKSMYGLVQSQL